MLLSMLLASTLLYTGTHVHAEEDVEQRAGSAVVVGTARFTVITPSLLRCELANSHGQFENRPSLVMSTLDQLPEPPPFRVERPSESSVVIRTEQLVLRYSAASARWRQLSEGVPSAHTATNASATLGGFTADELNITLTVSGKVVVWQPGMKDDQNLNGTLSALDCYSEPAVCAQGYRQSYSQGLVSRAGWATFDDSATGHWESEGSVKHDWRWFDSSNSTPPAQQDIYFFGHGHRYKDALRDFMLVAGRPAMPPLSAFGIWWSRYWVYSSKSFTEQVLDGYAEHALPLNHVVMDMDWHTTGQWGGYSWNRTLFPDVEGFINGLHTGSNSVGHPLKLLLNLHPGFVGPTEDRWVPFVTALGYKNGSEPFTNSSYSIACAMNNRTYTTALFSEVLGSFSPASTNPNTLVDYWWTDWGGCQSGTPALPDLAHDELGRCVGSNNLWWGNYVYHSDPGRFGGVGATVAKRGLVLSRYGGLGTHRYPVGFSGDAQQAYVTLQFQIEMTPKASNVLFGYWSHDLGGFHNGTLGNRSDVGDEDPKSLVGSEMYLRWLQFGALSPMFRTHCNLDDTTAPSGCDPRKSPDPATGGTSCIGCERRIWMFPHYEQMKDAMVLRNSLAPYIYTAARQHYDSGVSLIRPLYYEHPEVEAAYSWADTQYYFGDSMVVAPIAAPASSPDPYTGTAHKELWVPPGTWVDWNGQMTHVGPQVLSKNFSLSEIPILVSAGGVVPLKTMASVTAVRPDPLVWAIFVPDSDDVINTGSGSRCSGTVCQGRGEIYEDDGETRLYETSPGEWLTLEYSGDWTKTVAVKISPPSTFAFDEVTSSRGHVLQLRGLHQDETRKLIAVHVRAGGGEETLELEHLADTSETVESRVAAAAVGWWNHLGHSLSAPRGSIFINLGQHSKFQIIEATLTFGQRAVQQR